MLAAIVMSNRNAQPFVMNGERERERETICPGLFIWGFPHLNASPPFRQRRSSMFSRPPSLALAIWLVRVMDSSKRITVNVPGYTLTHTLGRLLWDTPITPQSVCARVSLCLSLSACVCVVALDCIRRNVKAFKPVPAGWLSGNYQWETPLSVNGLPPLSIWSIRSTYRSTLNLLSGDLNDLIVLIVCGPMRKIVIF